MYTTSERLHSDNGLLRTSANPTFCRFAPAKLQRSSEVAHGRSRNLLGILSRGCEHLFAPSCAVSSMRRESMRICVVISETAAGGGAPMTWVTSLRRCRCRNHPEPLRQDVLLSSEPCDPAQYLLAAAGQVQSRFALFSILIITSHSLTRAFTWQ